MGAWGEIWGELNLDPHFYSDVRRRQYRSREKYFPVTFEVDMEKLQPLSKIENHEGICCVSCQIFLALRD